MKKRQCDFLEQLNRLWMDHAQQLVFGAAGHDATPSTFDAISHRLQTVATHMEWIGARVTIHKCPAHPKWEQRQGIMVSSTSQTWKIIEATRGQDDRMSFHVFIVPKKQSVLIAEFCASGGTRECDVQDDEESRVYMHLQDQSIE